MLNPESLESILLSIISIEGFEKAHFEQLFSNKTNVEQTLEVFSSFFLLFYNFFFRTLSINIKNTYTMRKLN